MTTIEPAPSAAPPTPAATPIYKRWWFWLLLLPPVSCCCVGVGSAVAIPGVIRYIKQSKATEARTLLHDMSTGVQAHCAEFNRLPGAAGPIPATVPGPQRVAVNGGSDPGFAAIHFTPSEPVYYQYSIVTVGEGIELRAVGDLDGDGVLSHFTIACPRFCECQPMTTVDELE